MEVYNVVVGTESFQVEVNPASDRCRVYLDNGENTVPRYLYYGEGLFLNGHIHLAPSPAFDDTLVTAINVELDKQSNSASP